MRTSAKEWQLINCALIAATKWERSLADAWKPGTQERQQSNSRADEYEKILAKRGIDVEAIFRPKGGKSISIYELLKEPIK